MRLGHFDLNLLLALDALLDTRSVTRAGERLHIGTSATSSALGRLRVHFDDPLLIQVGRRMELTPLGRSLAEPVRDIILTIQSTVVTRLEFDPSRARRNFVIRASDYVTTVLLTDVVQRLQREAPGITLHIANMTDDVSAQLDRGEVDFLIYPSVSASQSHPLQPLFEDSYCCLVWKGNTAIGDSLTPQQYRTSGHVALCFGDSRTAGVEGFALANLGVSRTVEIATTNFNALPQLVVGTTRIGTIQTRLAQIYARYLPLRIVPLPFDLPPLVEVVQWHSINTNDPAHAYLRRVLLEQAQARSVSRVPRALHDGQRAA